MTLDPKRWTIKTGEAVATAMQTATSNGNPELTVDHLMSAIAAQNDTVVPALLAKLGVAATMLRDRADKAIA